MGAYAIGEYLAYMNWTVLAALAVGASATVVLLSQRSGAARGYLAFTAVCAALAGLLALATDSALPQPAARAPFTTDRGLDPVRQAALWAFVGLSLMNVVALARNRRSARLGGAAMAMGVVALVVAGIGWGGGVPDGIPLVFQLCLLAASLGGATAAMVLGHWYLVTPRLPEAPLVLVARLVTAVVAIQVVLFVAWAAVSGDGAGPFAVLRGSSAMFAWLRLVIGLLVPLAVSWGAARTAAMRAMESATGLLYVDVGMIAAGTILAAGLYFGTGLLT